MRAALLLIPENHTRNTFYLQNVAVLAEDPAPRGHEGAHRHADPRDHRSPTEIELPDGGKLLLEPLVRKGNRLGVEGFDPCVVLLNNDLSAGIPAILEGLEQPVIPPLYAGWSMRRKSQHFAAYDGVARGIRASARHRSLADQSVLRDLRRDQFPGAAGRGMPRHATWT